MLNVPFPFAFATLLYLIAQPQARYFCITHTVPGVSTYGKNAVRCHLNRYVILPRERSYGDNSTTTLSPGRIRM